MHVLRSTLHSAPTTARRNSRCTVARTRRLKIILFASSALFTINPASLASTTPDSTTARAVSMSTTAGALHPLSVGTRPAMPIPPALASQDGGFAQFIQKLQRLTRALLLLAMACLLGTIAALVTAWLCRRDRRSWPYSIICSGTALIGVTGLSLAIFTFMGLSL